MVWRHADALLQLRTEVNQRWPNRSKLSDGTIGDAAHASRTSDHNPWIIDDEGVGVVRAIDITADGIDVPALREHLRQLGKRGDPRLNGGGYIISDGMIASEVGDWEWRLYSGSNDHRLHMHTSFSRYRSGYDSKASWGISTVSTVAASPIPNIPTATTPDEDWFTMATLDELTAVVTSVLRSEGVTGAGDLGRLKPAVTEAATAALRSEGVSGAADLGRPGLEDAHRRWVNEETTKVLRSEGVSGAADLSRITQALTDALAAQGASITGSSAADVADEFARRLGA